jgi:hypothetical protein
MEDNLQIFVFKHLFSHWSDHTQILDLKFDGLKKCKQLHWTTTSMYKVLIKMS